jgi:DNA-binding NtrC family response regulator
MKSERALLVDVHTPGRKSRLCTTLQPILETELKVSVLSHSPQIETENLSVFCTAIKKQFKPGVVFVIFSHSVLKQARSLIDAFKKEVPELAVILVNESRDPTDVLELLKAGASDFVTPPLQAADVLPRAWRLINRPGYKQFTVPSVNEKTRLSQLVGESSRFLEHVERIPLIARCEANVLITGETGTGKEMYARAIHYCSSRASRPFMPVNCGAIPIDLVENELFGHERGAFTNAFALQTGLIEEANGGTLFLDEIDCLPTLAQVKLLRFLQEREYRPLGSSKVRRANVRIVAASNISLEDAVVTGRMRQDLFYRLNILSLVLPPLRERREDISLLASHFLEKYAREFGKPAEGFAPDVLPLLMAHNWPGNVRELEHVVERAVALCDGPIVARKYMMLTSSQPDGSAESLRAAKAREIAQFEKNYIKGLLQSCGGNITKAAQVAQKNRRAFWQLIQKHKIDVNRFRARAS